MGDMSPARKKSTYTPKRRTDRNLVGKAVRRLRQFNGLTQDEVVARAQIQGWSISVDTLKKLERGEREVTDIELKKLAKALRVTVARLFD